MSKSRDAVIAVTATIFFGVFSRVTVRIPYMVWGYFDESFFISFVWWLLYAGSSMWQIREYMENVDGYFKVILQGGAVREGQQLDKNSCRCSYRADNNQYEQRKCCNFSVCYGTGTADFWQWRDGVFILFCGKKENFHGKNPYMCMGGS